MDCYRKFFVLIFLSGYFFTYGQSNILVNHFDQIPWYYNPAEAMKRPSDLEVSGLFRSQWNNLAIPRTSLFAIKFPVLIGFGTSHSHAVSAMIEQDDFDFILKTRLQVGFGGFVWQDSRQRLDIGGRFGIALEQINLDDLTLKETLDPAIASLEGSSGQFMDFGAVFTRKGWRFGAAIHLGLGQGTESPINSRGAFGSIQKKFQLDKKWNIEPTILLRYSDLGQTQLEPRLTANYKDILFATGGFREGFGPLLSLGFSPSRLLVVSAASEMATGNTAGLGWTQEYFMKFRKQLEIKKYLSSTPSDSLNRQRIIEMRARYEKPVSEELSILQVDTVRQTKTIVQTDTIYLNTKNQKTQPDPSPIALQSQFSNPNEKHIVMDHIGFEPGLNILKPDSFKELDRMAHFLKRNRQMFIEIQGHTDNTGTRSGNQELSHLRALIVYNYLISRGVEKDRMKAMGYGQDRPISTNDSEEGKRLNRRIEVVLIKEGN